MIPTITSTESRSAVSFLMLGGARSRGSVPSGATAQPYLVQEVSCCSRKRLERQCELHVNDEENKFQEKREDIICSIVEVFAEK